MNNKIWFGFIAVVIIGLGYLAFAPRCEEPSQIDTAIVQLVCAQGINIDELRVKICQKLRGSNECDLQDEDVLIVREMFMKEVNDCAKASLKEQNKCTDKYEDLQ